MSGLKDCNLYYDLARDGWQISWVPEIALGIIGVAIMQYVAPSAFYWSGYRAKYRVIVSVALFLFAVTWAADDTYVRYSNYKLALKAYRDGHFDVIEGSVSDFRPIDKHKRDIAESFSINDEIFSYSPYEFSTGFQQLHADGSPIRNGLPVRITYAGHAILKLEVCDPQ